MVVTGTLPGYNKFDYLCGCSYRRIKLKCLSEIVLMLSQFSSEQLVVKYDTAVLLLLEDFFVLLEYRRLILVCYEASALVVLVVVHP